MEHVYAWDASDHDVSRGPMDLQAARNDGILMFMYKLTEGSSFRTTYAGTMLQRARLAGIPLIGGYHVVRSTSLTTSQVSNFLNHATEVAPWWGAHSGWFWCVDVERWDNDAVSVSKGMEFARVLRAWQAKPVIIYASKGQYGSGFVGSGFPLWNANYGSNPKGWYASLTPADDSSRWAGWETLLQYGSKTTIGRQNTCDASVFKGDLAALKRALGMAILEELMTAVDLDRHGQEINKDNREGDPVKKTDWRCDWTLLAELWTNEQLGMGPYDDPNKLPEGSFRTQQLRRIDEATQVLLTRPSIEMTEAQLDALADALVDRVGGKFIEKVLPTLLEAMRGISFTAQTKE